MQTLSTIKARVENWRPVKTRYGPRLVLNTKIIGSNQKAAVWSPDLDNQFIKSQKKGAIVELLQDGDNYTILERQTNPQELAEQTVDFFDSEEEVELFLPVNYSEAQLQKIRTLAQNRAKVLISCINAVKQELEENGDELYENSIRSLGVSLYISVCRHLD